MVWKETFSFYTVVEVDVKKAIFSPSDTMNLCEHHSHKTGGIGGCLIDIFVVCAHCMKGLIVLVKIGCVCCPQCYLKIKIRKLQREPL